MEEKQFVSKIRSLFQLSTDHPDWGEYRLAQELSIGHTTAGKYKKMGRDLGYTAQDIAEMTADEICSLFKFRGTSSDFVEPNWDDIRAYMLKPRCWGKTLPTIASAWRMMYVKEYFPDYVAGELPSRCMSERTFTRRYRDYLKVNGLLVCSHSPNPNMNFGPGSVLEIDTVGDRMTFYNQNGEKQSAVIFTAVLKFSGYAYVEAMPDNTGVSWARGIINACYFFGGVPEVLRTDNDSAISIHGNKTKKTWTKLRPAIASIVEDLGMLQDFCPVTRPQYKGGNERTNGILESDLFAGRTGQEPLFAKNHQELTRKILDDNARIMTTVGENHSLSRKAIFENYEKQALKPLPKLKPMVRELILQRVRLDGYVSYEQQYYYAGSNRVQSEVLLEIQMGTRLVLREPETRQPIAEYPIEINPVTPRRYHKADCFLSAKEKVVSRNEEWFVKTLRALPNPPEELLNVISWIYRQYPNTAPVATRICNVIYGEYERKPEDQELVKQACRYVVYRNKRDDILNRFRSCLAVIRDLRDTTGHIPVFDQSVALPSESQLQQEKELNTTASQDAFVRGSSYYAKFIPGK